MAEQEQTRQKRSLLPPTTASISEKVTKPLAAAETANDAAAKAEELQVFFEDNKRRYKSTASDNKAKQPMQPTPIMPIVVPDRMKARLREKYLHRSKRSYEVMYKRGEKLLATLKRQRSSNCGQLDENDDNPQHSQPSQWSTSTTTSEDSSSSPPSALSSSQSSHHKTSRKPTFSALESSNHEATDLTDDQETYDQANELEQHQEQRAKQNLLHYHNSSRATNDDEYDDDKANDPMLVAEYADDIFAYLRETEVSIPSTLNPTS